MCVMTSGGTTHCITAWIIFALAFVQQDRVHAHFQRICPSSRMLLPQVVFQEVQLEEDSDTSVEVCGDSLMLLCITP